jgi:molybdenum cofactor guanylyltransferase
MPISIAILAGGSSSRMGTDKSLLPLDGRSIFEHILERLAPLNAPIFIISNDSEKYSRYALPTFPDVIPDQGSLGGLYSAIYSSLSEYTLCVACDMPFLNVKLLAYQISLCGAFDLIVPRIGGVAQPFHAIYSKTCLSTIYSHLMQGKLQASGFYASLNVRWLEEDEICQFDLTGHSFVNINTPEDYRTIQQ